MTDWLQALMLGIIQGLTEFLPVSSSGHLTLAQQWLGGDFFLADDAILFDLVLHLGTLLPVLWFYRAEVIGITRAATHLDGLRERGLMGWLKADPLRWLGFLVCVATVPTGLIGVGLKDVFESLFHSPDMVAGALLLTGFILMSTRFKAEGGLGSSEMTIGMALLIGLAQGFAITPGISRSGSTIAMALLLGMNRELAARFSFLISVPAIMGALLLMLRGGISLDGANALPLLVGFATALIVGYGALVMLVALVKRGGLHNFAWYLWPLAIFALLS